MTRRIRGAGGLVAPLTLAAACSSPTKPTPQAITLTCPADIRVGSVSMPELPVTYPLPTATGGTPPININCSPASNSNFSLGDNTVTCNATDGTRTAMCTFKVSLVPPQPVLSAQHFVAFGDSITAGENGDSSAGPVSPLVIDLPNAYPTLLGQMLTSRYTTQTPIVNNCGLSGEAAQQGAARVDGVLDFFKPDALLIMEGVNNLTGDLSGDIAVIEPALRHDVFAATSRNLPGVFLSNLLPMNPNGYRAHNVDEIRPINDVIRSIAFSLGAIFVDNYAAFQGHPEYLDVDGLHPLPAGNQAIAQTFFNAIQVRFETLQPTGKAYVIQPNVTPFASTPLCPNDNAPTAPSRLGRR